MTHDFDQAYWQNHWRGDRTAAGSMSAAPPNPYVVRETRDLTPSTALDAGCGAGAESLWLAAQGWHVTGADISAEALRRAAERAQETGLQSQVTWREVDLSTWEPEETYDLVMSHYAHSSIPQLEFYKRIARWVEPC